MTEIPEGCVNVRNAGSIVDRPLLNTKWMLPNSTIVLSVWFIIRSNSFTLRGISIIFQMLLHSSMIRFPLNSGVSSRNFHEYGMADVSTTSISFSRHIYIYPAPSTCSCEWIASGLGSIKLFKHGLHEALLLWNM